MVMRKTFICFISATILFVTSHAAFALDFRVKTYSQLYRSLESGYEVRAVTDFNKCTVTPANSEAINGSAIGGFNFTQFLKYQIKDSDGNTRDTIATSTSMLVSHPKFGHVYNYVRLRVFPDDSAEISSEIIDPKNFTALSQKIYRCQISNGEDKNGLSLFMKWV